MKMRKAIGNMLVVCYIMAPCYLSLRVDKLDIQQVYPF